LKGAKDLLAKLQADEALTANASMKIGLQEMELLFGYLEAFDVLEQVSFDLSLARGLDYYTGLIYEVVTEGSAPTPLATTSSATGAPPRSSKKPSTKSGADFDEDRSSDPSVGVGSVAAGGRYDNLVGMFSGKTQIPCVGISFGVDRIFSITKARMAADNSAEQVRNNEVDVYVMAFGGKGFTGLLKERMQICTKLWEAGIKAEFLYKVKPKLPNQFKAAEVNGVPFAIVLGEEEVKNGQVKIKEMGLPETNPEKEGVLVSVDNLVNEVRTRLARKARVDRIAKDGVGLRVVGGIRGEEKAEEKVDEKEIPIHTGAQPDAAAAVEEKKEAADGQTAA